MSTPSAAACFAINVRREIDARGWTQAELARRAELPQPRIAEVMSGRFNYRLATVERIADALGVVPGVLILPPAEKTDEAGLTALRQSV